MKTKAILFDFDGVIVESIEIKAQAFVELFRQYPQHCTNIRKYHLANGGLSRFEKFRHIYRNILKQELSADEELRLSQEFSAFVVDRVVGCPYVPGAEEALRYYSRMMRLFVVSGTPEAEINLIVKRREIVNHFSGVFGAPVKKVDHIRRIMLEYEFSSDDIVFVGDALEDYRAAKACGIRFVGRVPLGGESIFKDCQIVGVIRDLNGLRCFIT